MYVEKWLPFTHISFQPFVTKSKNINMYRLTWCSYIFRICLYSTFVSCLHVCLIGSLGGVNSGVYPWLWLISFLILEDLTGNEKSSLTCQKTTHSLLNLGLDNCHRIGLLFRLSHGVWASELQTHMHTSTWCYNKTMSKV